MRLLTEIVRRKAALAAVTATLLLTTADPLEAQCGPEWLAVGRDEGVNGRWFVYDSPESCAQLQEGAAGDWGEGRATTALAYGDFEGDGVKELVVGRSEGVNMRWRVWRRDPGSEAFDDLFFESGNEWGASRGVTAIATGDIAPQNLAEETGDGRDEIVIGRNEGNNMRWAVYQYRVADDLWVEMGTGGEMWGPSRKVTDIATGDIDGDGLDEFVIGRNEGGGMRWAVYEWTVGGSFQEVWSSGHTWGADRSTSAVAMGDLTGNGNAEVIIGRNAGPNMMWAVYGWDVGFGMFHETWVESDLPDGQGVTALAAGDFMAEGRDALAVGLSERDHEAADAVSVSRWQVWWYTPGNPGWYGSVAVGGYEFDWPDEASVTALAFGDVDHDGDEDLAVGRTAVDGSRWFIYGYAPAADLNNVELCHGGDGWGDNRSVTALALPGYDSRGDRDGDGLLDCWEEHGYDADWDGIVDIDLPAMGADPDHKDIFLELDWMLGEKPNRAAIQTVKAAFAAAPVDAGGHANPDGQPGINLWVDTGTLTDPQAREGAGTPVWSCSNMLDDDGDGLVDDDDPDCLVGDDLGDGEQIPAMALAGLDPAFYGLKATYFDAARRGVFRYGICATANPATVGEAEFGGNDMVVFDRHPGVIMHELGHLLRLDHGGGDDDNCKPNHVSVMNADHVYGIIQSGESEQVGQDLDNDGRLDGLIVDFSPPRRAGGTRGGALPTLVENALSEQMALDPLDDDNHFVYVNSSGQKVHQPLSEEPNWLDDGLPPAAGPLAVNIDTSGWSGTPADCTNAASDSTLEGHDDWSAIELDFRQFPDPPNAPHNPLGAPEPPFEQIIAHFDALNRADLRIQKTDSKDPVVAGEIFNYTLSVTNGGDNPARDVEVTDFLPSGFEYLDGPPECELTPEGNVFCDLGEMAGNSVRDLVLTVKVPEAYACIKCGPIIENVAEVINQADLDPQSTLRQATEKTTVICPPFLRSCQVVGTNVKMEWELKSFVCCSEFRIEHVETGMVVATLPAGSTSAAIPCANLPTRIGTLRLVCVPSDPDHIEASDTCEYECPVDCHGPGDFDCRVVNGKLELQWPPDDGSCCKRYQLIHRPTGTVLATLPASVGSYRIPCEQLPTPEGQIALACIREDQSAVSLFCNYDCGEAASCEGGLGSVACKVVDGKLRVSWEASPPECGKRVVIRHETSGQILARLSGAEGGIRFDCSALPFPSGDLHLTCTVGSDVVDEASCSYDCALELSTRGTRGTMHPFDANGNASVDIADALRLLDFLGGGAAGPLPCGSDLRAPANVLLLDWNGDAAVDISDAVAAVNHLFVGGPPHVLGPVTECQVIPGCEERCGS